MAKGSIFRRSVLPILVLTILSTVVLINELLRSEAGGVSSGKFLCEPFILRKACEVFWFNNKFQDKTEVFLKNENQVMGVQAIRAAKAKNPANKVYFGLWTHGFFDPLNNTLHPEALKAVEQKIGKKAAIAHYYRGWEKLASPALLSELQAISANGWRPMVSANPYFFEKCNSNGMPLYKAIASGNCDEFMHNIGKNLKAFGKPVFLRWAWEMNTSSMEWQVERTGSTNPDFVAAWRKFHDIVYAEQATNVLWVFCPDVANTSYSLVYPGDAYVDWIGLDGYNWGTTQSWSNWKGFSQVYSQAYAQITKLSPNKPLMLGEVNTTDQGGDKPAWYKDMLLTQVLKNFPRIKAVVFYNEDRSAKEGVNWLIDVTPASLQAFSEGIKTSNYLSNF